MRTINLVSVVLEGFRSFRERTTIEFSQLPGFKFMTGRNEAEPGLGANGAGKSTLFEGITWINFGTSIKDQRASDLVTWGTKRPHGICNWNIDGELVCVLRGGNPNYLSLDGQPVEQSVIDRLLGRTKKQFVQSVIWGQGAKTFIDLSIPERAVVLDDVLDLGFWLSLSDTAGKKVSDVEKQVDEIARQIAYEDGRLASLPNDDELIAGRDRWEEDRHRQIQVGIQDIEQAESVLADLIETASRLEDRAKEHNDVEDLELIIKDANKRIDHANQNIGAVLSEITSIQKTINFFTDHPDECPTCNQRITATFARNTLRDERKELVATSQISKQLGAVSLEATRSRDDNTAILDKKKRIREHLLSQIRETGTKAGNQDILIRRIAGDIDKIGNAINPWITRLDEAQESRQAITRHRSSLVENKQALEGSTLLDSFWKDGFKRVRLFEINRILTHLELEVENAASLLGLFNWRISVTTETENKSGGTRHGVQIQITSPETSAPWESWSGGEGQRIRLAVAIGFANLIERMTATCYGIEVWDEPTSFMSAEGIDDYLACMRNRVDMEHKSVWLIDCGVLVNSGFDEVYQMTKTREGSKLILIASDE